MSARKGPKPLPPLVRFMAKVDMSGDCWLWTASRQKSGYGTFYFGGRSQRAHRFSYLTFVGEIPEGMEIDHLCRNRSCVNPEHLQPVTHRVNILRGDTFAARNAAQTHCRHGHEFTDLNTYREPKNRTRHCRICRQAIEARRPPRSRRRAAA